MTYILIVAGTALALYVASLRERRNMSVGTSELRAPGHKPGASPFYVAQSKLVTVSNNVRFTPKSGHLQCASVCPLCANSGHSVMSEVCPFYP